MHATGRVRLICCLLLLLSAHRLPAPITEENPTPAAKQSNRPKIKRSEGFTKSRPPSPTPSPPRNLFEGTWLGTLKALPFAGDVNYTLTINAAGTVANEKSTTFGSLSWPAT